MGQAMHSERRTEPHLQLDKDNEWLDEALRDTFPASDPIPSFHKKPEMAHRSGESSYRHSGSMRVDDD